MRRRRGSEPAATRPGPRGWRGRGRGGSVYVQAADEWRGTTVQVCGLWPFATGAGSPMIGVPLGRHLLTDATLCCDPISWFAHARLIHNPSAFVLGKPGLGKALDVDTEVPTPSGAVRLGDLRVGDAVFDEHGQPTTVMAVSETRNERDCMLVRFSDGTEVVADAEHLWVTETQAERQRRVMRRLKPPRAPLGTPAEQARAAALLSESSAGQTTTLQETAKDLGWDADNRWHRLYRWALDLPAVGVTPSRSRSYNRTLLLQQVAMALADRPPAAHAAAPVTTRQIAATLHHAGKTNHAIPVTGINLSDADLPLAPRLLGLWLGDGNSADASFTTADPELAQEFAAAQFAVRAGRKYRYSIAAVKPEPEPRPTTCELCGSPIPSAKRRQRMCSRSCASRSRWVITTRPAPRDCIDCSKTLKRKAIADRCPPCAQAASLIGRLRKVGVLGNKHIPTAYLRASVTQRRALLSGLLDTDGTVGRTGQVQFSSTNQRLAEDVRELVASLGYRPTLSSRPAKLNGRRVGTAWQVGFTALDDVFGLARKRDAHRGRHRGANNARTRLRHITAVEPVAPRPVRCIQVANPSGMYLVTRSFIATHNSTLVRRMALGLAGYGVMPLVLGDLKPDYVDLIEAIGGQVITLGLGRGHLNVLDPGEAVAAADRLTGTARQAVIADARGRRHAMVAALITILRSAPPTDREETILERALRVLDERHDGVPVLADLLEVIHSAPDDVRHVALDRGNLDRYREITEGLEATLIGLLEGGRLGEIFSAPTTTPMRRDRPVVFDVSSIDDAQTDLQAAVLLACWSYGFGAVNIAHTLADAGLEKRRHHFVILDELWRALRAGRGMVDRVDALTRLNRQRGVGTAMISHTMSDLLALPTEEERMKARGFAERSGMLICGGLPSAEMPQLTQVVPFSDAEQQMLIGWQNPPAWDPVSGAETAPPGRGNFLVKVGGRPGIPVHVGLTGVEHALNDTNKRWHDPEDTQGGDPG